MVSTAQIEKAARFAALHRTGCFVLPNAWDIPSALLCHEAGFPAVGTSSMAVALAHGVPDGEKIGRDRMLAASGAIARRVPIPVTADLEAGYGPSPRDVAETVRLAIAAGLVGCNLEDTDPVTRGLTPALRAAERIAAAVQAAKASGLPDFVINARTDPYYHQPSDPQAAFAEAVVRGNMYLAAGATCVFVPVPSDLETAKSLVSAIDGPVNLMAAQKTATAPFRQLAGAGVRRISMGGSLMAATYAQAGAVLDEVRASGTFDYAVRSGPAFLNLARLISRHPEDSHA
ncbi:isocitrate lyase/phosphoenolpyruvate mutase family protein [Phenylobacterium sp.]|uniref:isocitrate lyase/PEP mutase family protein n=1 Tax=Phenylobacterium sp. TaxID=1871053 RepID=UPI0027354097|nr:isocitrate lyase/phosphoenolpyruvate mutase family protein [Phenylobacterium sp.]MDP3853520.1 isocitrate lyase/phosphoenolpyruvate mutase family protein [Phenylobacterium sp.]